MNGHTSKKKKICKKAHLPYETLQHIKSINTFEYVHCFKGPCLLFAIKFKFWISLQVIKFVR